MKILIHHRFSTSTFDIQTQIWLHAATANEIFVMFYTFYVRRQMVFGEQFVPF